MQGQDIAPEYAEWRVGPNGIQVKDLRLAALEQVSAGSWQPRLFYIRSRADRRHSPGRPVGGPTTEHMTAVVNSIGHFPQDTAPNLCLPITWLDITTQEPDA